MNYGKKATMQLLRKYDNKSSKVKNKVKLIVLKILLVVVIVAGAAGISAALIFGWIASLFFGPKMRK